MNAESLETVLRRSDLPRGQITLLKATYERAEGADGRDDGFVSYDRLADRIRWGDEEQLRGVLGAFGNRINATDAVTGDPGIEAFFERRRRDGHTEYRLRPEAQVAVERVSALRERLNRPMSELLEPGTRIDAAELDPDRE